MTLSARVDRAARSYRAEIRDISAGGLLLAPADGLPADADTVLSVEAAVIGRVTARVVDVSRQGLHLKIEGDGALSDTTLSRLAQIARTW